MRLFTVKFVFLLSCLFSFLFYKGSAQISLPYEQDFSSMFDSLYTEPTSEILGVPNFSIGGSWEISYVDSLHDGRYRALIGVDAGSYDNDSLIYKVDLSSYEVSTDDIIIAFDVYSSLNQIWSVFVRESSSAPVVKVGQFDLGLRKSDMMSLVSRAVSKKLASNNQNYSSNFEIIFTRTGKLGVTSSGLECLVDRLFIDFAPNVDIDISGFEVPQPKVVFTTQDRVTLEFTNLGMAKVTTIPVTYEVRGTSDTISYEENFDVNLLPDSSVWVTSNLDFDLSSDSVYWIHAVALVPEDAFSFNDHQKGVTFKPDVYKGSLPYTESFDINTNYQFRHFRSALPTLSGFSYMSENVEESYAGLGSSGIYLGRIDEDPKDFILLTMDLNEYISKDVVLSFSYEYSFTSLDEGKVYGRGSENDDWVELYDWFNEASSANVEYLPLTPVLDEAGQNLSETTQIMFYRGNGRSSSFRLSYLQVKERPEIDMSVFSLSPVPSGGFDFNLPDTLSVSLVNHGANQVTDFNVYLTVEGENGVQEKHQTTSLNSLDSITLHFKNTFDFSMVGNYQLNAYSSIEGDSDANNDTLSVNTYRAGVKQGGLPYFLDFSGTDAKNYSANQGVIDNYGELSYSKNSRVGIIDNYGFRSDNQSLWLGIDDEMVLTLDLQEVDTTQAVFLDFALSADISVSRFLESLQIRGGLDQEWKELGLPKYPLITNSDSISSIKTNWSRFIQINLTDTLKKASQNFSSFTQIKFPGPNDYRNVIYDDIIIYEPQEINLELWDMNLPESFFEEPVTDEIQVRLINRGNTAITQFDLQLESIDPDGVTTTHTFSVEDISLLAGDTLVHLIENPVSMLEDGKYQYLLKCDLAGDAFHFDDQLKGKITNKSVVTDYPYSIDIVDLEDETVRVSGEFEQVKGWYIESENDYMSTELHNLYRYQEDSTFRTIGTDYARRIGGLQTYTWTFDLTNFSTEDSASISLLYDLSYFPTRNGADDGLYVRGGLEDEWILVERHGTDSWRSRYIEETVDLSRHLKQNDQEFSNKTQLKVIATNGSNYVDFNLMKFEVAVEKKEQVTGLKAFYRNSVIAYPNPAKGYLIIEADKDIPVVFYDLAGQIVLSGVTTNEKISVLNLKPAVYIGKVYDKKNGAVTFKWIKEN